MEKLKMETNNVTEKNIEKIAALFPNVITEMKDEKGNLKKGINFELLKQELSEDVADGEECYDFTWVGKKAAIVESNTPIRKTLRPCIEESKDWENTENLYIEGDNLEVLKLLQESYLNSIKLIYIDPPYNTGNDFIYKDNFKINKDDYEEQIGLYDEEDQNMMFKNTDSNGRFHSDWCSMMYSRLKLANNLLKDEGMIFISCDDNESANLRNICDEIYGEQNFIGTLIRKVMEGGKSDSNGIAIEHEYCHSYVKAVKDGIYKRRSEKLDHYNKKDEHFDERGYYYLKPLENGGLGYVASLDYAITGPDYIDIYPGDYHGDNGYRWVWSRDKYNRALDLGMIEFTTSQKDKNKYKVYYKIYEKVDTDGKPSIKELPFQSMYLDGYTNRQAINDIKKIFDKTRAFDYPKPVSFLQEICRMASKENDYILDFFSGSATTAHAIMQLNAEDGGNRKFIMVQLPEKTDENSEAYKAGYKNICEIGKERIRRAGEKIKSETEEYNSKLKDGEVPKKVPDIGFRVLKVDSTNMKDVYYSADEYKQENIDSLVSNIKEDRTDLDLLYGVMLDWNLHLSLKHEIIKMEDTTIHIVDNNSLIACFENNVSENVIREIAKLQPLRVVFRDSCFENSPDKINVEEIFKLLTPNTSVRVI